MLATLSEWSERCSGSLSDLEKQIEAVKSEALRRAREEQEWNKEVEKLLEGGKEGKKEEGGGSGSGSGGFFGTLGKKLGGGRRVEDDSEEMDVDEDGGKGKNLKRSFGLLASGK